MDFYGYFRSSAAYRCRIAFNLKAIQPVTSFVHLRKGSQRLPEYLAKNPLGLVPALDVDGQVITQSLSIIELLDEVYPHPPLLPVAALDRAYVRSLALLIACDTHPLQNLRVLTYLRNDLSLEQSAIDAWCRRWIGDGLSAYEATLKQAGKVGDFSFGDAPTLADLCLIPQLYNADRFNVSLADFPRIQRIRDRCDVHPAFSAAHPSVQPDAE